MRASKLWSRRHNVPSPFLASHTLWIKKMEICWRHQSSRSFQTWKLEIEKIHTLRNIAHHKQTSIHVLATNSLDIGKFAEAWSYTCIHYHLLPVTVVTEISWAKFASDRVLQLRQRSSGGYYILCTLHTYQRLLRQVYDWICYYSGTRFHVTTWNAVASTVLLGGKK